MQDTPLKHEGKKVSALLFLGSLTLYYLFLDYLLPSLQLVNSNVCADTCFTRTLYTRTCIDWDRMLRICVLSGVPRWYPDKRSTHHSEPQRQDRSPHQCPRPPTHCEHTHFRKWGHCNSDLVTEEEAFSYLGTITGKHTP